MGYTSEEPLTWTKAFSAPQSYRPGPLSEAQFHSFWDDGFAVVKAPDDLPYSALIKAIMELVELNAQRLVKEGKLRPDQSHEEAGFSTRQGLIEDEVPGASFELFMRSCNGPGSKIGRSDAGRALQSCAGLLDMAQQLLGSADLSLSPAMSCRVKCPVGSQRGQTDQVGASGGVWHQDTAYVSPDAEDTPAVTIWLPLDPERDTTEEMGTMQYERGGHRRAHVPGGRTLPHHVGWGNGDDPTAYMQLDQDPQGEFVTVEVPKRHLILTSNIIPHRGLENRSRVMRWTLDMRFLDSRLPAGAPTIPIRKAMDPNFVPDFNFVQGPINPAKERSHPWAKQKAEFHKLQAERKGQESVVNRAMSMPGMSKL